MLNGERRFRFTSARLAITAVIGISILTLAFYGTSAAEASVVDSVREFFGLQSTQSSQAESGVADAGLSAESGEPLVRPIVSTTLTISHAYGGGGGSTGTYLHDYVEIKNISSSSQSLNGLSLYYGSATGQFASSAGNAFALPDVTLAPGRYFLVQVGPAGTAGGPLPVTPDATTTNLTMSASNGKLALVTAALAPNTCGGTATPCTLPNPAIIDLVAWGTANNAEGGAPTNAGASLTSTQGNVRKVGGCLDTDNNNADFDIVSAPVPRNTASAAALCSGGPTPTNTATATASPSPTNTFTATPTNTPSNTSTGTPAASPTPPQGPTFVLSQVYGGGGGSTGTYLHDYVEIKNITGVARSLNGLSLYYGAALGNFASSATNAFALPDVSLNPGQYYLVQLGNPGTAGAPLPVTPDATTTNLNMAAGSGKVALTTAGLPQNTCGATATPCNATQLSFIVDWVAYGAAGNGTAGNGEGGTSVNNGVAITSTQGGVRKVGGCQDTNNNNNDFDVVDNPVPRNTSTTIACAGGPSFTPTATNTSTPMATNTPTSTPTGSPSPRTVRADFDGDGKSDVSVFRPSEGNWYVNRSTSGFFGVNWGLNGDVPIPGDFDGDGKTDIAVFRGDDNGANPDFFILNSSDNTVTYASFGLRTDIPLSGDIDGDGKTDLAVYRLFEGPPQGYFFVQESSGGFREFKFGAAGDIPLLMDYENDGRSNVAVFRPSNGTWYIARPTGVPAQSFYAVQFGLSGDMPVPADYDGDRRDDVAVFRPSSGIWYGQLSTEGFAAVQFGLNGDVPVPGDYDGDSQADVAVYRNGIWYFDLSNSGFSAIQFGLSNDIPIPKKYIP